MKKRTRKTIAKKRIRKTAPKKRTGNVPTKSRAETAPHKDHARWPLLAGCLTVFISNFCIMALEIVAGRIIARSLGTSLYTWTSVIGVVLAGITIGNYFGGSIADRFQPRKTLALLFAICSFACVVTIIFNNLVGNWNWLWYMSWPKHVFVHIALVFLLPSILLGAISPVVAKMALDRGLPTGRTVGDIYAWGAAGSIIGTFVTGYWLIALIGTIPIIWLIGATLLLIAIVYRPRLRFLYVMALSFIFLWLMGLAPWQWCKNAGAEIALRSRPNPAVLYEDESQYCYIAVERLSENPDKRKFVQDKLTHSEMIMGNTTDLQYSYMPIIAAVTKRLSVGKDKLSTLSIGGGGYVFPRYIESVWPGSHIDLVEIDPGVTKAAMEAFGLSADTTINTYTMDARNYVDWLSQKKANGREIPQYDFIYEDAINDYSVPFQLVTREFNEKVAQLLTDDGVYMINLIDIIESGLFVGAFVNTLEKTFSYVEVILEAEFSTVERNTIVIVASQKKLDLTELEKEYTRKKLRLRYLTKEEIDRIKEKTDGLVLTDDYVPVENLIAPVVRKSGLDFLVQGYNKYAAGLAKRGEFDESIKYYQKILKVYDETEIKTPLGTTHYRLAIVLKKAERLQEANRHFNLAVESFRKELEYNPYSAPLLSNMGHVLALSGNFKEAVVFFKRALELDITKIDHYTNPAMALKKQGKTDEAIAILRNGYEYMLSYNRIQDAQKLQQYIKIMSKRQ